MGSLMYADVALFTADDRALRHLEIVIERKLRQRQSFAIHWKSLTDAPRGSAWISPGVPVSFAYATTAPVVINEVWIRVLLREANDAGLRLISEPVPDSNSH